MRFQRSIINILLVDEEASGLRAMLMDDIHEAAGFAARCLFQFAKDLRNFGFFTWICRPCDRQNYHGVSRATSRRSAYRVERAGERIDKNRLFPVRPSGNDSDLRASLLFDKRQIILGLIRKLVVLVDSIGLRVPAR